MDNTQSINMKICAYNANGFKGNTCYIKELCHEYDCVFICETMLQQSDSNLVNILDPKDYWSQYIWSNTVTMGRPSAGLAFIIKRHKDLKYCTSVSPSHRVQIVHIKDASDNILLTIIGVYMPCNTGTTENKEEYIETLNQLQGITDSILNPYTIIGDFNSSLPLHSKLTSTWYKTRPFTPQSSVLYNFICDNDLAVGNMLYPQKANYTWHRGNMRTLIDFIFLSPQAKLLATECTILEEAPGNTSDHLPVMCNITLRAPNSNDSVPIVQPKMQFPRTKWNCLEFAENYKYELASMLRTINVPDITTITDRQMANAIVNKVDINITNCMHDAASRSNPEHHHNRRPKNHLAAHWNGDCSAARDRHRLWFHIWKDNGRPREGATYACYKLSKTQFRNTLRDAANDYKAAQINNLCSDFRKSRTGSFWNKLRKIGSNTATSGEHDITIASLESHFSTKFGPCDFDSSEEGQDLSEKVHKAYTDSLGSPSRDIIFTTNMVNKYVHKLNMAASPGNNGIDAHHIKYGCDAGLAIFISYILTLCLRFSVVPQSFYHGILIPIPKKSNCDKSLAENYRPLIVSVTMSKILELYILDNSTYQAHEAMFGYVDYRGTNMAISLAHDIIGVTQGMGSTVYLASLDAAAAFDGISHNVLFDRARQHIAEHAWSTLFTWYKGITARIKYNNSLSGEIKICKGTRQGGLSSSLLFNIVYHQLVATINSTNAGVTIGDKNYNTLVYADDILILSTTPRGLQTLLDTACQEIKCIGLQFNAKKTFCQINGKAQFLQEPNWHMNNSLLSKSAVVTYLGGELSNNGSSEHTDARINACTRSFYGLASAGMYSFNMPPDIKACLWRTIAQPALLYACESTPLSNTNIKKLEQCQSKLIKSALGLSRYCQSTKLLQALHIDKVKSIIEKQTLTLMRNVLRTDSLAQQFYLSLLTKCDINVQGSLITRSQEICMLNNCSLFHVLTSEKSYYKAKAELHKSQPCGIVDSIGSLLSNYNKTKRVMLNMLLLPF